MSITIRTMDLQPKLQAQLLDFSLQVACKKLLTNLMNELPQKVHMPIKLNLFKVLYSTAMVSCVDLEVQTK